MSRILIDSRRACLVLAALLPLAAAPGLAQRPARPDSGDPGVHQERHTVRVVVDDGQAMPMRMGRTGYLGVELLDLTPELRRHFGAPEAAGVMVARVQADSPAAQAGIEVGDILTALDDDPLGTAADLRRLVLPRKEGETVGLALRRDGRDLTVSVTLVERERSRFDLGPLLWVPEGGGHIERRQLPAPGEEGGDDILRLDPKSLDDAIVLFRDQLGGDPALKSRLQEYQQRNEELEKRLEVLEKRLKEMEKQLEKLAPPG